MAQVKLNTTTSIVDLVKSLGKDSSFTSRKSLYETSGLSQRLGAYTGSADQNVAFIKQLNSGAQQPAEAPPVQTTATPPAPSEPAPSSSGTSTADILQNKGLSATDVTSSIPEIPSADEILNNVFNSAGFQNYSQKKSVAEQLTTGNAESQKAQLESRAKSDTQSFINQMGRRGLYFSGETQTGLASLAESLAMSKLDIDRNLAGDLLKSDLDAQEFVLGEVEKLVKSAQAGRKEAIDSLEKVGLTVIGDKIVPTLTAQNAALAAQREERIAASAAENLRLSEERLTLSEEAAARAERALVLRENDNAGGGTVTSGGLNISKGQIGKAANTLNAARGPDGWTDPYLYLQAYQQWTGQGGLPQDFVKSFPPSAWVNPEATFLPTYLQNKPSNNVLTITPSILQSALEGE